MFNIQKTWLNFIVNLKDLHAWMLVNAGDKYCGMSAGYDLTLHFNEEPTEEIKAAIDAKWDALTAETEAAKWQHDADLEAAVVTAKTALLTMDLITMNLAERKLFMNMPLTDDDKNSLLLKYPQGGSN